MQNNPSSLSQSEPAVADNPTKEEIISVARSNPPDRWIEILPIVFKSQSRLRAQWTHLKPDIDRVKQEHKQKARKDVQTPLSELQPHNHQDVASTSEAISITTQPRTVKKSKSKPMKRYGQHNKKQTTRSKELFNVPEKPEQPPAWPLPNPNDSSIWTDGGANYHGANQPGDPIDQLLAASALPAPGEQNPNGPPVPIVPNRTSDIQQRRSFETPFLPQHNTTAGPALTEWNTASAFTAEGVVNPQAPIHQPCGVYRGVQYICSPPEYPPTVEDILCSDMSCDRKWWGREYLWKFCGIDLKDAWEILQKRGKWLCPLCLSKAEAMAAREAAHRKLPHASVESVSRSQSSTRLTSGMAVTINTSHLECELRDDEQLRDRLQHLTGLLHQYTAMVRNRQSSIEPLWRLVDVPSVRDETFVGSKQSSHSFIQLIRDLVQAPDGILIKDILQAEGLDEIKCSVWIHGVLSHLIGDFIFSSDLPFGDATLLQETLALAGISDGDNQTIIHDHRLRLARNYDQDFQNTSIPADFKRHIEEQQQTFLEKLNAAMLSLIGGDRETQKYHLQIAKAATGLKLMTSAYRGTFKAIRPGKNDVFNSQEHASDTVDPEGKIILATTRIGVKYILPGKPWTTCLPARVELWPQRQMSADPSRSITLSEASSTSPSTRQHSRGSPKKRGYEEMHT